MRQIITVLLGATALSIACAPATLAADMSTKAPMYTKAPMAAPAFSWTGFYLGGDVGYGWGRSSGTGTDSAGLGLTPYDYDTNGVIGGGFLGYNYQINQFVVGVEADWQVADLKGNSGSFIASGGPYTFSTNVNNYGSLRGRLGYAVDRWLVFATGGWAWGYASTSFAFTGTPPFSTNSGNRSGWTGGGGVEYAITNNWLARLEYRYTDLGSRAYVDVPNNSADNGNRITVNDVRLGVAYKF